VQEYDASNIGVQIAFESPVLAQLMGSWPKRDVVSHLIDALARRDAERRAPQPPEVLVPLPENIYTPDEDPWAWAQDPYESVPRTPPPAMPDPRPFFEDERNDATLSFDAVRPRKRRRR
jgi:hypothetical protein